MSAVGTDDRFAPAEFAALLNEAGTPLSASQLAALFDLPLQPPEGSAVRRTRPDQGSNEGGEDVLAEPVLKQGNLPQRIDLAAAAAAAATLTASAPPPIPTWRSATVDVELWCGGGLYQLQHVCAPFLADLMDAMNHIGPSYFNYVWHPLGCTVFACRFPLSSFFVIVVFVIFGLRACVCGMGMRAL